MNYSYFQMEGRSAYQFKTRINFPDDLIKVGTRELASELNSQASLRFQNTERGLILSESIEGVEDEDKYDEQAYSSFAQTAFGSASNNLSELYKEIGSIDDGYEARNSVSNGSSNNFQQISTSN